MRVLDTNKDYATICGGELAGHFIQGGVTFDPSGEELAGQETEAPKNKGGRPAKMVITPASDEPAIDPELQKQIDANLEG